MQNRDIKTVLEHYQQAQESLLKKINSYSFSRKIRIGMKYDFLSLATFFLILLVFLLMERTPIQSEALRWIHAIALYSMIIWWSLKAIKTLFRSPEKTKLAVEIEESTDKFNSGLSSAVEFTDPKKPASNDNTSEIMRHLAIIRASEELKPEDIATSLRLFSSKKHITASFLLALIACVWYAISPIEVITGATRLIFPQRQIAPYSTLQIVVKPENTVVATGESIEIIASLSRKSDKPIILELFEPDKTEGKKVEMYPSVNATESQFIYTLTSLQESVDYRITCEKFISPRYSIRVVPRPQIKNIQLTLFQPSYVSSEPIKPAINMGDAEVLKGSRVKIEIIADQKLVDAAVSLSHGATQTCKIVNETGFICETTIATDTKYSIYMKNEVGLTNENPVIYTILAKEDGIPTIELLKPAQDMPFPTSRRLDIKAVARDDYGVKSMVLYYKVGDRKSLIPQNLKPDFRPKAEYEVEFPWMLDTLALQPGIRISYFIQAEDAKQPTPNVATSPTYFINMPSMHDLYRGEDQNHKNVIKNLEEFIETQSLRREALMEAYEQIKHEEKLDFEAQQAIDKALEEGEKSQREADNILEALKKLQDNMVDNPMSSPEALERMQKVSELLEEVLDDETKQMMQQLREALQEIKIDATDIEKFEEAFTMEEYLQGLDRNIELLTQLREQQKINSLAQTIEDLYNRQQQIASDTAKLNEKMKNEALTTEEESQLQDLTNQQEKIGEELKQLQKQSEELTQNKKADEFKMNPLLEDIKNIRDRIKKEDHQKRSEDIKKDMQQKDLSSANKQQQNMLEFLKSLKKQAEQISMAASNANTQQLDLSTFIRKALQVSHDQERLYKKIENFPAQFMRGERPEIAGLIDQVSVLQVLVRQQGNELENDLEEFIRSSFSVDPSAIEAIKNTQIIFARTVKELEDRALSEAREDQLEIVRRFNKLAVELMRVQDQSGESGSSNNPMDALQQFKNLTRRQLSLYQQMMKRQMSPQTNQMMKDLKRMAMEQRKIRESLERLMRENRQQMNSMGRLDDVIQEMRDIETEILNPELSRKVGEKQKKIYDKMLRAQKAIKDRDEESEERQARKSKELIQQQPDKPLSDTGSDTRDLSQDFLSDMKEEYPESYKPMINDYYKSLNIYGGNE